MDFMRLTKPPITRLACLFLASRLALLAVGLLSTAILPSGFNVQHGNLVAHRPTAVPLEIWARWDSEWYLLIAAEGYEVGDRLAAFGVAYEPTAATGFLPSYPLLIRWLSPLLGPVAAGVLISNICLFLSMVLLERLVRLEVGGDAGARAGLMACAALLVFPTSLFLSAVYSESLFLALSLAVFICARTGRFAAAGVLGGLAALTRPFGVLLVIPIVWEWWSGLRHGPDNPVSRRAKWWDGLWAGLIPLAFGTYMLFCSSVFGDALALFHRQQRWRGSLSGPWRAFVRWWEVGPRVHGAHGSTVELVVAVICIVMLFFMARRLRGSYTLYAAVGVTLALGSTLWSFSRLVLTLFPFFMFIGMKWADGRRCLPLLYAFAGTTLSGLFMALFANWWWVG
jgi:hypothetical protein